jgi:hypothetical protein
MGETLFVVLPLLALIVATLCVAALWYWWSSSQDHPADGTSATPHHNDGVAHGEFSFQQLWNEIVEDTQAMFAAGAAFLRGDMEGAAGMIWGTPTTPQASDGETVEALRLLRDLADGKLIVEIGGRRYRSIADMTDPQVRRRFMGNAQALTEFVHPPAAAAPVSQTPTQTITESTAQAAQTTLTTPPAEIPKVAKETRQTKTMADEIEEALQVRLAKLPELSRRSIHILSTPDGGVRVQVDDTYFDGISDVTDDEIRTLLQNVIHDWESYR